MKLKRFFCVLLSNLLVIACAFSLTCCKPQTNGESTTSSNVTVELIDYKVSAIDDLFSYVKSEMDEKDYSEDSYASILEILQESINHIHVTDSIANIDAISKETKEKIAVIPAIGNSGEIYYLQEAYQNGLLTKQELQIIANYRDNGQDCPDSLSEELIEEMKEAWIKKLHKSSNDLLTVNDVTITRFYGMYRDSYVIMLDYGQGTADFVPVELNIDGIIFRFGHPRYMDRLVVYKK